MAVPFDIYSLFDIVLQADILTGGLLLGGIMLGLNVALSVRYSNRKHGLTFVGGMTMIMAFGMVAILQLNIWWLFFVGFLEMILGLFLIMKETI